MTTTAISGAILLNSIEADSGQWVRVDGVMEGKPSISLCQPDAQWCVAFSQILRSSASNMLDEEHADALLNTFRCFTTARSLPRGLSGLVKKPNTILTGLLVMAGTFDLKTYSTFGGYVERFLGTSHSFRLHAGIGSTKVPVMLLNIKEDKHNSMGI